MHFRFQGIKNYIADFVLECLELKTMCYTIGFVTIQNNPVFIVRQKLENVLMSAKPTKLHDFKALSTSFFIS